MVSLDTVFCGFPDGVLWDTEGPCIRSRKSGSRRFRKECEKFSGSPLGTVVLGQNDFAGLQIRHRDTECNSVLRGREKARLRRLRLAGFLGEPGWIACGSA